jgi:hypothetical protein
LPLRSRCADLVLASSTFEHDTFFWETFLELARILKSGGVLYLNAPSNGEYRRYPNDNWRFYPDSGKALECWAEKGGYRLSLIESFVAERRGDQWNDFVAVFAKEAQPAPADVTFMSADVACANVWQIGAAEPLRQRTSPQDMVLIGRAAAGRDCAAPGRDPNLASKPAISAVGLAPAAWSSLEIMRLASVPSPKFVFVYRENDRNFKSTTPIERALKRLTCQSTKQVS